MSEETVDVLTVYLDQNKWIDLARAATGHRMGEPFKPVLDALTTAAADGRVRFPLSAAHYFETGKQSNRQKRMDLATTMVKLATQLRIAPPHRIVPWEIRRALVGEFDLPDVIPDIDIFGEGVAHALHVPSLRYEAPSEYAGVALSEDVRAELQRQAVPAFEAMVLADVMPAGVDRQIRLELHKVKALTEDRFVQGQKDVAAAIKEHGRHRLDDIMLATAYTDIREPIALASYGLGLAPSDVADHMDGIIRRASSRWVEMKLRHQRQANPEKSWEGNDLNDVIALSVAVPYCDVVVTEKSWSAMINAAKANEPFGTIVTPRIQDVVDMLG